MWFNIEASMVLIFLRRMFRYWGAWKGKWAAVCISQPQLQNGYSVSWKLCLIFYSRKWLRPSRNLISYLTLLGPRQLNSLLGDGLTKCRNDLLKMFILVELRISISNLIHSRIRETTKSETTFHNQLNTDY